MMKLTTIILSMLILISCKKDDKETFPPEPIIGLIKIEPQVIKEFDNSVAVTISYSDNNGDLGFENPDVLSLQVKDSRLDSADGYHIPPLSPIGHNIIIEGQLTINLNSMFILGNGNEEVAALSIKLKDRSGNWSNEITTPNITIQK